MQKQELRQALAYCDGRSFAEVAEIIGKSSHSVTRLHVAAMAIASDQEYAIGGESETNTLRRFDGTKEAY
jgi:hypothetical protein